MTKPWLTDPKYGGMSERSARLSHEAWVRGGCRPARVPREAQIEKLPPLPDEQIERIKRSVERQLEEYGQSLIAAVAWWDDWKLRRPRGFRCKRPG